METVGLVSHPQGRTWSPSLEVTQTSFKQQMDRPRPRPQQSGSGRALASLRDAKRRGPDPTPPLLGSSRSTLRQHKADLDSAGHSHVRDMVTHQATRLLGSEHRDCPGNTDAAKTTAKESEGQEGGRS